MPRLRRWLCPLMSLPESDAPLLDLSNLKFQPAWVNEPSDFSNYAGSSESGDRRHGGDREGRRPRPGGGGGGGARPGRDRPAPGARREPDRGPARTGGAPRPDGPRRPRPESGPRGPRDPRAQDGPRRDYREEAPQPLPAVKVEFLPDEAVVSALAAQIRATHLTYPLFGLAKKFLEKPEYHRVMLTAEVKEGVAAPELFRVGDDGMVTLDRRSAERIAFERNRAALYEEKTEQGEPPKGNFSNVARCRLDGTLLGPTNHHAYQTALRSLYDQRYSRRMPFEHFRREIEVVNDPAEVEKWKEQSRASTTYTVIGSEPPVVLKSPAEVRQHFDDNHLGSMVQNGPSFILGGPAARSNPDPALSRAMRSAWEAESRYPGNLVQHVRAGLQKASLQIFKHRKKFVHVSGVRPLAFRHDPDSLVSESVQAILAAIGARPGISRKALAEKILGPATIAAAESASAPVATAAPVLEPVEVEPPATVTELPPTESAESSTPVTDDAKIEATEPVAVAPEDPHTKAKAALVADLLWLVTSGHVIAFHDGTYDLPPSPMAKPAAAVRGPAPVAESGTASAPVVEAATAPEAVVGETPSPAEDAKIETTILEPGALAKAAIATPITEAPIAL